MVTASRLGGQAMIEFIVGLVAVLVVFAALIQIRDLGAAENRTLAEARRSAGIMSFGGLRPLATPEYIRLWQTGADRKSYTRDDTHTTADPGILDHTIVDRAAADAYAWEMLNAVPHNEIKLLHNNMSPQLGFGFVGDTETEEVPLLPVVRHLLYGADQIEVESSAWTVWTEGIY